MFNIKRTHTQTYIYIYDIPAAMLYAAQSGEFDSLSIIINITEDKRLHIPLLPRPIEKYLKEKDAFEITR